MSAKERHATSHLSLCLPAQSDNSLGRWRNKLFTQLAFSEFLGLLASWSSSHAVELQVSHVAGADNQWVDNLSRGRLQAFQHRPQERVRIPLERLASAASSASWSSHVADSPAPPEVLKS